MKFKGLHGLLLLMAAVVMVSVMAQTPRRGTMRRDNSPIRPTIPTANRNQAGKVFLERANELRKGASDEYQVVVGDVLFRRGGMFMYCDSALFYDDPGALKAYGNVRMEQGDTLFVYADELDYSDSTKLAVLYADAGKKVRLINRDVTLTTDIFNYDLEIDLGYYEVGGVLTDPHNRLSSWYGEYSPQSKDALFHDDVKLHSLRDGDTLDIFSERMLYNTYTHIARLDDLSSEAQIISKDGVIYTYNGVYNTDTQEADLYSRSLVVAKNGNTLTGDTLFYDRQSGYGEAFGNIELTDTSKKVILSGIQGFYYENLDSARVWGNALAREYSNDKDTLFLHGDTIALYRVVTLPAPPVEDDASPSGGEMAALPDTLPVALPDSLPPTLPEEDRPLFEQPEQPDTAHFMVAWPNVKFFRSDIQGLCDSMTFASADTLLYLDRHPVVWNENKQIFGNQIILHLNDSTVDWARLPRFGFVAEHIDEEFYSQLAGKEMFATFLNGELRHLDVSGNVQAIMLPQENDSTYNKIANLESSYLSADFAGQTLERMKLWPETSGTMTPLFMAKADLYYLPSFRWFEPLRPRRPEDVFIVPQEMRELFADPPFK